MDADFSGMKYILLSILLLLGFRLQASGNSAFTFAGREIITSEIVSSSGLTRVGEILLLCDGLTVNSTDGYTWRVSMNGLSSFQRQNWIVMLDGQRIDLSSFDFVNLNMIPTVIDDIDFVEIFSIPQIREGEFTDKGLIHIHTKKPNQGISVQGHAVTGSETKDPGPHKYTEFATPNVDRTGTDYATVIDLAFKNWYANIGLITQTHSFTDLAMVKRNKSIHAVDGFMELGSILSFFKMGLETSHGKHQFLANYANANKYFLFFKPIGREIPVDYTVSHLGINGDFPISENLVIKYRLKYSNNQFNKFPNVLDFDYEVLDSLLLEQASAPAVRIQNKGDWKSSNFYANLECDYESDVYNSKLGVGFDRFCLDTSYQLANDFYDVGKVYGTLDYSLGNKIRQGINTLVTFSGDRTGIKGAFANHWKANSSNEFSAILSFSQKLFEEDNSLWYWSERGYDLLQEYGIDYTIIGNIDNNKQFTADIIWEHNLNRKLTLAVATSYRLFDNLYLERQNFDFQPEDCSARTVVSDLGSPIEIYANQSGQILGGRFALKHRPIPQLGHRFFYSYRTEIEGDFLFKDVWKSVPRHKASYKLIYTPVENFSIWAMLTYLSSSRWIDYQNIDETSCALGRINLKYSSTVKNSTILDLHFQKWLWRRRLQISLLLRNVLDRNYHYHPIGASFDLGFYVQIKGFFSM